MLEIRSIYGFPIVPKPDVRLENAQEYVTAAKALTTIGRCEQCRQAEQLESVLRIIEKREPKK